MSETNPEQNNTTPDLSEGAKPESEITDENLEKVSGGNWFVKTKVVSGVHPPKIQHIEDEANGSAGQ